MFNFNSIIFLDFRIKELELENESHNSSIVLSHKGIRITVLRIL